MDKNEILRQQLHRLLDLVLDTNGFESRRRDTTGTMPTVFLSYSGHVNDITIDIHKDGWTPGAHSDEEWSLTLKEPIEERTIDEIQTTFVKALKEKTKAEVLRRDIERVEKDIASRKETVAKLKKELKKEEKGEKDV